MVAQLICTRYSRDFGENKIQVPKHNLLQSRCECFKSLPFKIPSDQPVPFSYEQDSPMASLGVLSVLCRWDWNSSSSIPSYVIPDGISGSGVTISSPAASASTLSTTSEPPNSAMTASWILWLAARKLPREMVGKPCDVLLSGCAFLWRLRWNRQMMIVEILHVFSKRLQAMTPTHLFWIGARTASRVG